MKKEVQYVKITEEQRKWLLSKMRKEINDVAKRHSYEYKRGEANKILKSALDQLNKHVTHRAGLKSQWVIDELVVPIEVEYHDPKITSQRNNILEDKPKVEIRYACLPDKRWITVKKSNEGISQKEFEETVYAILEEDARVSAYYSSMSWVLSEKRAV